MINNKLFYSVEQIPTQSNELTADGEAPGIDFT
jgi:hypothetical protein